MIFVSCGPRGTGRYVLSDFDGIREFVAVAESSGFSAAARRLGLSTSHVSRQVSALEARLSCVLLVRTTRRVKLTSAGETYYNKCRELMDGLDEANESLHQQQIALSGTLRVSAAGEFSEAYVVPALVEFAQMHPKLSVDINFNSRNVDFVEEGIDFAIRYGHLNDSGLVARKLADRRLVAAASRAYLDARGVPEHPADLSGHDCLVANNPVWGFDDAGRVFEQKVAVRWQSNSARALVGACQADLGICYMPRSSYGSALKNGSLVPILESYSAAQATWIVYGNRRYLPARARQAIDFLLKRFAQWSE